VELALWILVVIVLGLGAVVASGRFGELPTTVTDTPKPYLPAGVLSGDDIRETKFSVTLRGYSVQQVDELLDRVALQFDQASAAKPDNVDYGADVVMAPVSIDAAAGIDTTASFDATASIDTAYWPELPAENRW
jgi:DivIVA domain-containing protein